MRLAMEYVAMRKGVFLQQEQTEKLIARTQYTFGAVLVFIYSWKTQFCCFSSLSFSRSRSFHILLTCNIANAN